MTAEQMKARIAELEAERDALKVDAERYRWLRKCDRPAIHGGVHCIIPGEYGVHACHSAKELDAAIDAARNS